jgi:hypothetical protein
MKSLAILCSFAAICCLESAASEPTLFRDRERAELFVSAIKHVAPRSGDRSAVFVVDEKLLPHISKSASEGLSIVGDASPFVFPAQTSSDKGPLYFKVTLVEGESDRDRADVTFRFFIGVENSATWRLRFRKSAGAWRVLTAEIISRS